MKNLHYSLSVKTNMVVFFDVNGNMWQHAQAINNDGSIMTYDDYLKLKQLKEME